MTPSRSFYVGPDRPRLQLGTWRQLCAAADAGLLQENQWLECKQDVPKGRDKSRELAKDLASLSVDGGIIVVGAVDKLADASGLLGLSNPDELADRISQVATSAISPPLNVVIDILQNEDPAGAACLVVAVPASAAAPHMVDEKYWGRSATGKRVLSDHEVRRLFAERNLRAQDFKHQLLTLPNTFDPIREDTRNFGHIYLYARPVMPPATQVPKILASQHPENWIQEFLPGKPQFWPGFTALSYGVPHADGLMVSSLPGSRPAYQDESNLLQLLLDDSGGIRVTSGNGTRHWSGGGSSQCISPNYHLELAHQLVSVSAGILSTHAAYNGNWDIGVHATKLQGLKSTFAMSERNYRYSESPFQTEDYTSTISADTNEMLTTPQAVVERLYSRFTRGMGLDTVLFPYDTFATIYERIPHGE